MFFFENEYLVNIFLLKKMTALVEGGGLRGARLLCSFPNPTLRPGSCDFEQPLTDNWVKSWDKNLMFVPRLENLRHKSTLTWDFWDHRFWIFAIEWTCLIKRIPWDNNFSDYAYTQYTLRQSYILKSGNFFWVKMFIAVPFLLPC